MSNPHSACLLAPSILSADFTCLGLEVQSVLRDGADWIHFDVMDNHFVPNLTFGPVVCEAIRSLVKAPIDAHLMVEPVEAMVESFAKAGADYITVHVEACKHLDATLRRIRALGAKSGAVLNPSTPLCVLDHVLDQLDLVVLMSVNPGFGGQSFIAGSLGKVRALRAKLDDYEKESGRRLLIEVDGGVKPDNAAMLVAAGADVLVAGSAVFCKGKDHDYTAPIGALKAAMAEGKSHA